MRKIFAILCILMFPLGLFALPVGNPWDASLFYNGVFLEDTCRDVCDPCASWCDAWSLRVGFYADYIHDRKMELDIDRDAEIRQTRLYTQSGFLALNFFDRLDLYTALGTSHITLKTNIDVFSVGNGNTLNLTLDTETEFSYVLGAKATLWQLGCFAIGADLKYFYTNPDVKYIIAEGEGPIYPDNFNAKYREWQFALGAAYRVNIACSLSAIPYLAIKAGHTQLNFGNFRTFNIGADVENLEFFNLENQRDFGYVFGISLLGCDKWEITAEWRFIDEIAFDMNTQFRF